MKANEEAFFRVKNEDFFVLVKQRLELGERVRIPIVGRSMEPFLRERDEVLLQRTALEELRIGDVVLGRWQGAYVLHRLVRKTGDTLWLAGDNNLVQLEEIAAADLLALVIEARRKEKILPLSRAWNKKLGMLWYRLRFPRRVLVALKRRISK